MNIAIRRFMLTKLNFSSVSSCTLNRTSVFCNKVIVQRFTTDEMHMSYRITNIQGFLPNMFLNQMVQKSFYREKHSKRSTSQMSGEEEYCIRAATSADVDDMFKLMKKAYFPYEPLNIATGTTSGPSSPQDVSLLWTLDNGLTAVAVVPLQDNKERLIGICFGEENTPETWKHKEESLETIKDQTTKKIKELNFFTNKVIDIWNKFKISKRLDLHHLCVDPEFRRRGIGIALVKKCIEIAKSRGHTVVYSECSSVYSIKIAESLGMKCVFQIYFKDYKGKDGLPVFNTPSPHSIYKLFVLNLYKSKL